MAVLAADVTLMFPCCCVQRIATEITVLQSLQHPLLPRLHQVYTTGDELCIEMTVSCQLQLSWLYVSQTCSTCSTCKVFRTCSMLPHMQRPFQLSVRQPCCPPLDTGQLLGAALLEVYQLQQPLGPGRLNLQLSSSNVL
jgi:hypothetical protein